MELKFEFATASKILFGRGSISKLPGLLQEYEGKILLVTGRNFSRYQHIIDTIKKDGIDVIIYSVDKEPTVEMVSEGVDIARSSQCVAVIGLGGGSVVDAGKAIAALASNRGEVIDYLEVIGKGKLPENNPLPYVAVPTTAGTGSEVTKNAVILSPEHQVKVSLRSERMYPVAAVVDPELALTLPAGLSAISGMDALSHLLETYVSNTAHPFIDMFCREGLARISESIELVCEEGSNLRARENMAFAAMLGGIALANVKLGAVHGFAGPMGGMLPVPHGAICAALLPPVMKVNYKKAAEQSLQTVVDKYDDIGKLLTGKPDAMAQDGIDWVKYLLKKLQIPSLSTYGLTRNHFPELVKKAKMASSMKGNPVILKDEELTEILEEEMNRGNNGY